MLQIKFNEETYNNVPESYAELTLGKFMAINKIDQKQYKSSTAWTVKLISLLIGCPEQTILDMHFSDLAQLIDNFQWITKMPEKKDISEVEIEGVKYIKKRDSQLTTGEWISIESLMTDDMKNDDNFHIVLAILLRPEIDGKIKPLENDIDVVLDRAQLFKDKMPIDKCYGMIQAFSNGDRRSTLTISQDFSIQEEQKSQS